MPTVNIPNLGKVNFPDSMSEEDISNTIRTKILPQLSPVLIKNQSGQDSPFAGFGQGMKYWKAAPPLTMLDKVIGTGNADQLRALGDKLFTPNPNDMIFRTDEQQAPTTVLGGIGRGLENVVNSIATPGGIASGALAGPLMSLGRIPALLTGGAGVLAAAPALGQSAGILWPGSGATTPQRAEAAVLPAAMALPVAHGLIKDAMTPTPQMQGPRFPRPGEPDYLTFATSVSQAISRSRPASEQIPSPTAPLPYSPAGQNTIATASKPTATGSPFNPFREVPQNAAAKQFQAETKVDLSKMSTEQLQAAYKQAGVDAQKHGIAGRIQDAVDTASKGQFYNDEIMRRDIQHSLKAAASALDFAKKNKTMTTEEINAAMQHGDEVFKLSQTDPPKAVKAAQNLYESIRQRNAEPINETIQQNGQEKAQGKEQNAAQTNVRQEVPKQQPAGTGRGEQPDVKSAGVLDEEKLGQRPSKPLDKSFGEKGFLIAPREMWDSLFNNKATKVDPQQLLGRLRNKLGETSATFQALTSAGLSQFLSQPRSVDEVQKWAEENTPKVEVRKFGEPSSSLETKELGLLQHKFDTLGKDPHDSSLDWTTEQEKDRQRMMELTRLMQDNPAKFAIDRFTQSHWQSIAPKSEQDMPGYVEIAVVKPLREDAARQREREAGVESSRGAQFPSSHNFPPNTLGFVRGYMETLPNGKKVFHVIEVQSDWAQQERNLRNKVDEGYEESPEQEARDAARQKAISDPLLPHYERLALKAAIDHARSEGADAIAISDAETAMMTEGHDRLAATARGIDSGFTPDFDTKDKVTRYFENIVKPKYPDAVIIDYHTEDGKWFADWNPSPPKIIEQEPGMRLHYDQTLPKIAGELTGEKGEGVSFGEHRMAFDASGRGEEPLNLEQTQPRKDLIFRNSSGQPKTDVSARMFNIAKAKKEFSLYGRSGAIFPKPGARQGAAKTLPQIAQSQKTALGNLRDKFVASIKTSKPKEQIVRLKDAADNLAKIYPDQMGNGLRLRAKDIFGPVSDQALRAVTAAVEANGDRGKLNEFITIAKQAKDKVAENAAVFANNNWDKIQPLVDYVNQTHDQELTEEQAAGLDIEKREGYIRHAYDLSKIPSSLVDTFLGTSGTGSQRGFQKSRTFDTLYDAIKGGYGKAIRSWDAANLVENRLRHGQQMINDIKWLEGLKGINDPTTKKPIVTNLVQKPKANGGFDMVAPAGYETWAPFRGAGVAVHRGYINVLHSITALSEIRKAEFKGLPIGQIIMKGTGTLKHSMLLFDTYHAIRMTMRGASHGVYGPSKGLSLLEYSPADLNLALKNKEITKQAYDYAIANEPYAKELIKGGLNVGRISEGLDSEIIRDWIPKLMGYIGGKPGEIIGSIPGNFNKWVFEKLTRGIMMDAAVKEYQRTKDLKATIKDVNTYYGNLGRQGAIRSSTIQDIARFVTLAPQWFESMAKTEAKSIAQIPKAIVTGEVGSLLKGTSSLLLWMFIGTQLLNLATRKQFTFQNEEPDHKLDAWVPSVGKGNGFWISPFTVPFEILHDIIRYQEAGKTPLQTVAQIVSNKESPLMRALETLKTGEDYEGNKLPDGQRLKTAAENLIPAPLPLQPFIKGGYPGQVQRQLMASAGFKAEPAQGNSGVVRNLRKQWLYKQGLVKLDNNEPSEYTPLKDALAKGDIDEAKQLYQALLQKKIADAKFDPNPEHKAKEEFQEEFNISAKQDALIKNRGQVDENKEKAFVKTLTPHQQDLYKQVVAQEKQVSDLFFNQIQQRMTGQEPRGIRPPTIRRARGFSR